MIQKVQGEQPFQVLATNFSIGPSNEGYTLQISADGNNYTNLFNVDANTTRMVTAVANGSFYRMLGNNSEVAVNWRTQCNDGGSGGGSYVLPTASETVLGGVKVGEGLSIDGNGVLSSQGGGSIDSGAVLSLVNSAITDFSNDLQEGEPIVGMAKQLYSPDGTTSEGAFAYRTTAGDADMSSAPAELRKIEGNSIYPETQYNDSAVLERGGEEVEGFTYDIEWGNTERWVDITNSESWETLRIQVMRFKVSTSSTIYENYWVDPNVSGSFSFYYNGGKITADRWTTAVTNTHLMWDYGDVVLDEDGYITISITGGTDTVYLKNLQGNATIENQQYLTGANIPNDIPAGESTYVFAIDENNVLGAWTPTLPQALQNMQIDGSDYVPQDGDEIIITRVLVKNGTIQNPQPSAFVSVGLNSFCKDSATAISDFSEDNGVYTVTVYAVAGLEAGYVVYDQNSGITAAGIGSGKTDEMDSATTVYGEALSVVYPTTAKPYIIVTTTDIDGLCIHPRWSGYNDEVYEPYEESRVEGLIVNTNTLYSVGNTRDIWDLEKSIIYRNIKVETYSAARVNELLSQGKVLGVDFDFDTDSIFIVRSETSETPVTPIDYGYKANDFGVEYYVNGLGEIPTIPLPTETYYMNNLVDKLRRMEGIVHLDSLSGTGSENTLYECNDKLFMWSSQSGAVAEWTDSIESLGSYRGYGLAFSHIPDGQTIFEIKYTYDGDENYKAFKMSGNSIVMCDTGGTVLSACTVGEAKEMRIRNNNNSSYWVKVKVENNWIGFEIGGGNSFRNIWNGTVTDGHFVMVDHTNYPYMAITSDAGIALWNNKGQIIHKESGWSTRNIRFNTTGSSNNTNFITNGSNNGPDRMFVPTQGGTSGQLLLSSGGGEPTWSNWIKSVQITSDEYEALAVKDPSTLYLIVDE